MPMEKTRFSTILIAFLTPFAASAANISVLDQSNFTYGDFQTFFNGRGDTVSRLDPNFSSTSLTDFQLVITTAPVSLSQSERDNLVNYVQGGGRLVLEGEGSGYDQTANAANNAVLSALGSSIRNPVGAYDAAGSVNFFTTNDVTPGDFTAGVSAVRYAYTSSVTGGTSLFTGVSGQTIGAYEKIAAGYVFVVADTNVAEFLQSPDVGNGQLYLNFLNAGTATSPVPLPASAAMFGAALLGLAGLRYAAKRRKGAVA